MDPVIISQLYLHLQGLGGFGAEPGQSQQTGFRRRFRRRFQEALVQSQVNFNGFRRRPGRLWCTARSGSTWFRRRFRRRPGRLWCRARFRTRFREASVQSRSGSTGFWRRFRRGLGGFGAEPGQVPKGSAEYSGEGSRSLGAKPSQVQRVPGKVAEAKPSEVHLARGI